MEYHCKKCDMTVTGLACAKCKCDLEADVIDHEGSQVKVSKCPSCKGMIKSPQCCGVDMD